MKLSNNDIKAVLNSIDSMAEKNTCPMAFHAMAQPATAKLWIVIQLAKEAGVLTQIKEQIELN